MEVENGQVTEQTASSSGAGPQVASEQVEPTSERLQKLLSVDEAADICRVSAVTIRRAIKAGRISHIRIGSRLLISRWGVAEFLEASKVPAGGLAPTSGGKSLRGKK
jgi:excisionase family DNA binding protein